MVLCKFFLQGNCRFGENCKFEHQLNENRQHQHQQHASIIRQQNFTTNTNNANIDINTLIRAVTNDMLAAEKGGQWLLSCYAPFKEKPNFPGFEEQSFEEVRWGYYEAQRSGTVEPYNQQLQMALQSGAMKIRSLQTPSADAINTIKSIYNTVPNTAAATTTNVYGNSSFNNASSNPFGPSNYGNPNVFAQNQQQNSPAKSIFATANQKLFSNAPQHSTSIFANNQGGVNGQSVFANMQQNGNFTGAPGSPPFSQSFANQNPFTMQANQQNTSPFTAQQPFIQQQTGGGGFNTQPTFNVQQNPSLFAPQPLSQNNSQLFNPQQSALPFAAQQQAENLQFTNTAQPFAPPFAPQPNTNSPFSMQQQNPAPFTQQQANAPYGLQTVATSVPPFAATAPNIFAQQPPSNQTAFVNSLGNVKDENVYSKLEDLNENDIKAYESDNFEFGKIPEKPPTIQMCF